MKHFSVSNPDLRHITKHATKKGPRKVHEQRKARYRTHLKDFITMLHTLDVDVEAHKELFQVTENDVKRMKEKLGKFDINDNERKRLRGIFDDILFVTDKLLLMERNLWTNIKPWVQQAEDIRINLPPSAGMDVAGFFSKSRIGIVRNISKSIQKTGAKNRKDSIKTMRQLVLGSINLEHKTFFDDYPEILNRVESLTRRLIKMENNWREDKVKLPQVFIDTNDIVREIIHEDLAEIFKDIFHMYTLRTKVYNSMIAAAQKANPGMVEALEEERTKICRVGNHYTSLHDKHFKTLNKLYGQLGGK